MCVCVNMCIYHDMFIQNMLDEKLVEYRSYRSRPHQTALPAAAEAPEAAFLPSRRRGSFPSSSEPTISGAGDIACHNMLVPNNNHKDHKDHKDHKSN